MQSRDPTDPWSDWFDAYTEEIYHGNGVFEDSYGGIITLDIDCPNQTRLSKELSDLIAVFCNEISQRFEIHSSLYLTKSLLGTFHRVDFDNNYPKFMAIKNKQNNSKFQDSEKFDLILADYYNEYNNDDLNEFLLNIFERLSNKKYVILSLSRRDFCSPLFRKQVQDRELSIISVFELRNSSSTENQSLIPFMYNGFSGPKQLFLVFIKSNSTGEPTFYYSSTNLVETEKAFDLFLSKTGSEGNMGLFDEIYGEENLLAKHEVEKIISDYFPTKFLYFDDFIIDYTLDKSDYNEDDSIVFPISISNYSDLQKAGINSDSILPFALKNYGVSSKKIIFKLDTSKVHPDYIKKFTESYFMNAQYNLLSKSISQPFTLNKLRRLMIPELTLAEQMGLLESSKKIDDINEHFKNFSFESIWNPNTFKYVSDKIDNVLSALNQLADYDKVKRLIYTGESKKVEFKQTFSFDLIKKTREKYLEDSCIKTIAAFLNSDGGTLLIGVSDKGIITGLDEEISYKSSNSDKFLLHFKNIVKSRIGEQFYPSINQRLTEIDGKLILIVECSASETEVYVDQKDFFVRTNPSTDKLEGPKLVAYIRNRFKY